MLSWSGYGAINWWRYLIQHAEDTAPSEWTGKRSRDSEPGFAFLNLKRRVHMTNNPNKAGSPRAPTGGQTNTEAITRLAEEMLAAFEAKDSAKVNSYYAPGAVIATPGRPAAKDGRAVTKAIKDDIADPNLKISVSNEKTEVAGSGDLAYRRGSFKITTTNPQTKQAEQSAGTYLTVFRKQADESWKIVEDFGV